MILRNFSLAPVRVAGELDTFGLTLEVRASGKDFRYKFEDCALCDTNLEMGEVNTDQQLNNEDFVVRLNGDIAVFSDNSEDGDSWAAIHFGHMTVMEM